MCCGITVAMYKLTETDAVINEISIKFNLSCSSSSIILHVGCYWVQLYMACYNQWCEWPDCGQNWMKKLTKSRSIHVLILDFIALNDCSWINLRSWGEKMFKTITLWTLLWHQKFWPQQSLGPLVLPNTSGYESFKSKIQMYLLVKSIRQKWFAVIPFITILAT